MSVPTGLLILFPEVEGVVGAFRQANYEKQRYGLMSHLTLIYPFKRVEALNTAVFQKIDQLVNKTLPLTYKIDTTSQFPDTLFLNFANQQPLVQLVQTFADAFPENPPYEGKFDTIVPHITIANSSDKHTLRQLEQKFWQQFGDKLPITGEITAVHLISVSEETNSYTVLREFTAVL